MTFGEQARDSTLTVHEECLYNAGKNHPEKSNPHCERVTSVTRREGENTLASPEDI